MPAGRPPLFETPEDLEKQITAYFEYIKGETIEEEIEVKKKGAFTVDTTQGGRPNKRPDTVVKEKITKVVRYPEHPTITGLALYIGFESRQSFYDYEKDGQFSYAIKRARLRIESQYEQALHSNSPTGAIFALKNFGWKDKQEIEQSGGIKIQFADPGDYIYPSQDQSDSGISESL